MIRPRKKSDAKKENINVIPELIRAVDTGSLVKVRRLILEGADLKERDAAGRTPIHAAAEGKGNTTDRAYVLLVRALIKAGYDVNARDDQLRTPLHYAAKSKRKLVTDELLAQHADPEAKDSDGWSPLHLAVHFDQPLAIDILLNKGADVNFRASETSFLLHSAGASALHLAAEKGNQASVASLLAHGAHPNIPDRYARTPLHHAAKSCCETAVRQLLLAGALPNKSDENGHTPLHIAIQQGAIQIMLRLIMAGASVNARNKFGFTSLYFAAIANRNLASFDILLSAGANVNIRDKDGVSLLKAAIMTQATKPEASTVVQLLLASGAEPEVYPGHMFSDILALGKNLIHIMLDLGFGLQCNGEMMKIRHKENPTKDTLHLLDLIKSYAGKLPTLQQGARQVIRSCLVKSNQRGNLMDKVDRLPISKFLRGYVSLETCEWMQEM